MNAYHREMAVLPAISRYPGRIHGNRKISRSTPSPAPTKGKGMMTDQVDEPETSAAKRLVHAAVSGPPAIVATGMFTAMAVEFTTTGLLSIIEGITALLLLFALITNLGRRLAHTTATGWLAFGLYLAAIAAVVYDVPSSNPSGIWVMTAASATAAVLIYASSRVTVTARAAAAMNATVATWRI